MNDEQFEAFLAEANEELAEKQELLTRQHGLGSYKRWWWEQDNAVLQFFDEADNLVFEADTIDVGTYASKSNTWMWTWANDSALPWLRKRAEPLKQLARVTGMDLFTKVHAFSIDDEAMAWEIAAMCVKHLGAIGCYRAPSAAGGPSTFLAITAVRHLAAPLRSAMPNPRDDSPSSEDA